MMSMVMRNLEFSGVYQVGVNVLGLGGHLQRRSSVCFAVAIVFRYHKMNHGRMSTNRDERIKEQWHTKTWVSRVCSLGELMPILLQIGGA